MTEIPYLRLSTTDFDTWMQALDAYWRQSLNPYQPPARRPTTWSMEGYIQALNDIEPLRASLDMVADAIREDAKKRWPDRYWAPYMEFDFGATEEDRRKQIQEWKAKREATT
jgi:hypothetical protein